MWKCGNANHITLVLPQEVGLLWWIVNISSWEQQPFLKFQACKKGWCPFLKSWILITATWYILSTITNSFFISNIYFSCANLNAFNNIKISYSLLSLYYNVNGNIMYYCINYSCPLFCYFDFGMHWESLTF